VDERLATNQRLWDERAAIHVRGSRTYPLAEFKAGADPKPDLPDDIGPVAGKSILHLQCHFGMDSLSWARRGAHVTGVDFSPVAIAEARKLSSELAIPARFVESDIGALPQNLNDRFDIVLTYYGTITWLPDLKAWAKTVAHFLKPSGFFYIADTHPLAHTLEVTVDGRIQPTSDYFAPGEPIRCESRGSYADPKAISKNNVSWQWQHTLSDVLSALIGAGLRIDALREFPFTFYDMFYYQNKSLMQCDERGWWRLKEMESRFPLMFSLKAARI
jgi:2-polyprenyl-3-methyl-5-hydroxy-6-metoxy-1,4-benzoquinol methylase